jgi:hypothetical protein
LRKWDILKFESYVSAMFHQCFHVTCRHLSVRVVGGNGKESENFFAISDCM